MEKDEKLKFVLEILAAKYGVQKEILEENSQELADLESQIPEDIRAKIKAVKEKNSSRLEGLEIEKTEEEVKTLALEAQHGAKVEGLQVVFTPARITWDNKALEGYRAAHPEIDKFRQVGKPSASLRRS